MSFYWFQRFIFKVWPVWANFRFIFPPDRQSLMNLSVRKMLIFPRAKMLESYMKIWSGSLLTGNVIVVPEPEQPWLSSSRPLKTWGFFQDYEDVKWVISYLIRISWVRVYSSICTERTKNAAATLSYRYTVWKC